MNDLIDRDAVLEKIKTLEKAYLLHEPAGMGGLSAVRICKEEITNYPAVNRWIPCSARMPEKQGEYLVYFGVYDCEINGTDGIDKRYYGERTDGTMGWYSICASDITHWMPLPDPPEREEKP